jgi:hypothetical protein
MKLIFDKINLTKHKQSPFQGDLYKIYNEERQKIYFKLQKTKTLFGLESRYNNKYIKWTINYNIIDSIKLLENSLKEQFNYCNIDNVISKIIYKKNYPVLLESKISNRKLSNDIIYHEKGELTSYDSINNKKIYNVSLILDNIFIKKNNSKNTLYYNLEIDSIQIINVA